MERPENSNKLFNQLPRIYSPELVQINVIMPGCHATLHLSVVFVASASVHRVISKFTK